jgi:hypothetical protein
MGGLLGYQYHVATQLQKSAYNILAAKSYSSDLAGAATGSLLTSVIIIPLFGTIYFLATLAVLNLLAIFVTLFSKKIK